MTLAPQGFVGLTACVGLKQDATDFMLLASAEPGTTAAAVYTQSLFAGPSVLLNRSEDASRFRGVVTLSKNANVAEWFLSRYLGLMAWCTRCSAGVLNTFSNLPSGGMSSV